LSGGFAQGRRKEKSSESFFRKTFSLSFQRTMDVINKLNSIYSSVSNSVSQLSNHLPGNPLAREYEIENQVCSAGLGKDDK
jgi:hypothetical protein